MRKARPAKYRDYDRRNLDVARYILANADSYDQPGRICVLHWARVAIARLEAEDGRPEAADEKSV